jgi:hypothetical protein
MDKFRPSTLVLIASLAVMACKPTSTTVAIDLPSKIDFTDGFQQSDADAIIAKCGAKGVKLEVQADGEITFEPRPDSDYEASACVLKYIKESGATKFGFVGNEKYVTPEEGQ